MSGNTWRFIDSGAQAGVYNMQFDEALARSLQEGGGTPSLRIFRWKPWAISLGYNQGIAEIDANRCQETGIDVVRRPTGGRAILHAEELTYSVVMYSGHKGILQVYNEISSALVRGLRLFGVDATLQRSQPNFAEAYKHPSSIPCFTSSARYEIEWHGRKLVGSAQRRFADGERDVVLQHGSILCGPAHRALVDYLMVRDPRLLERIRNEMVSKTVDLSEIKGTAIDIKALGECIKLGFEQEWHVTFSDRHRSGTHGAVPVPADSRRH